LEFGVWGLESSDLESHAKLMVLLFMDPQQIMLQFMDPQQIMLLFMDPQQIMLLFMYRPGALELAEEFLVLPKP